VRRLNLVKPQKSEFGFDIVLLLGSSAADKAEIVEKADYLMHINILTPSFLLTNFCR
jgi:hypothetical protein